MANLSNINNKFLVTTGGNVLIGQTAAVGTSKLQVTGTMTADTVDGTVITDGFITMGFAQINRYGAAIELQYTPTNAATLVKIGANGSNPTIFNAFTGDATFAGDVLIRGTYNPYASANRANIALNGSAGNIISFTNNTSGKGYIYHDNTDLKILNAIAGDLIFYTNSTERMRINSSGNVRIGTGGLTNTHSKLDVIGGPYAFLALQATDTGGRRYELFSYALDESFHIYDRTNDQYRFTIDETGNVGIGTSDPAQNFVVADATNGNGIELVPAGTGTIQAYNRGTSLYNTLNIDSLSNRIRSVNETVFNNGSGFSESMRILSGGNVGIGVTGPAAKLHVMDYGTNLGITTDTGLLIGGTGSSGQISQIGFGYTENTRIPAAIGAIVTSGSGATKSDLIFATRDSTVNTVAPTSRMRIDSGGSVIIGDGATSGTPSADYRSLEIGRQGNTITGAPWKSNLYFSTNATITAGSTTFTARYLNELPMQYVMEDGIFTWSNAVAPTAVGDTVSFNERMRINAAGDVGIFVTNPGARLEVKAGTTYISNTDLGIKITNAGHRGSELNTFGEGSYLTHYFENYVGGSGRAYDRALEIVCKGQPDGTYGEGIIKFKANPITTGSNVAEIMRITGSGNVGIGTISPASNTKLDVVGAIKTQTVAHSWYRCGPITSALAYRHIKTNLDMGVGGTNIQYIMGGFEIKGYGYYGSYPGFGHGTCMFHNWSGSFASLDVRNYAMAGFVQNPYVSSDGFCVIVLRQNTYMQPVIDFCQYYTPYPWRTSVVTAESVSANLTGVY